MSTAIAPSPRREPAAPWKRRPKEPAQAYAAFVVYRDQDPPRSLRRAAAALGRGVRQLNEWSRLWGWVERSDAWTAHLQEISDAALEDHLAQRRREEAERLFQLGKAFQTAAEYRVLGAKDESGKEVVHGIHPDELDPDQAARWADLGAKLTRLSMGLPTDLTGAITVNLSDVQKVFAGLMALAEKYMTPEAHGALVRDAQAMVRELTGA